jgi:hypothetical protein
MARRIINVGIRFEITNLEQITDCKSADSKFDIANIEQECEVGYSTFAMSN